MPRPRGAPAAARPRNTAWALARMGLEVALLGRVGADGDGAFLKESLAGVNLDYLVQAGASGRAYILVDPAGERTILLAPNTNDDLTLTDLPLEVLTGPDSSTSLPLWVRGPSGCSRKPRRGPGDGPRITLDPGELYAWRGAKALEVILDQLDTLLVTAREWELLGATPKVHPNWAPPVVVIKRGGPGGPVAHAPALSRLPGGTGLPAAGHPGSGKRLCRGLPRGTLV